MKCSHQFENLVSLSSAVVTAIPGMRTSAPKRNVLVGLGYLILAFVLLQVFGSILPRL